MTDQTEFILPLPRPPPIPVHEEPTFIPGKFDYIKPESVNYKAMLVNAYQAITQTETWDFVKKDCKSFMFSNDPKIRVISDKMTQLGYGVHSGYSFGCTMRDSNTLLKMARKNLEICISDQFNIPFNISFTPFLI